MFELRTHVSVATHYNPRALRPGAVINCIFHCSQQILTAFTLYQASEKELRQLWRKWAKKEVQQYSTEKMVSQYEEVYKKALAAKKHE